MLAKNSHRCKKDLLRSLEAAPPVHNGVGLRRIASLLQDIFGNPWKEDPTHHQLELLPELIISSSDKETAGRENKKWVRELPDGTVQLYTDGTMAENDTTSSAWHYVVQAGGVSKLLYEGQCQIGRKADIEEGETLAIQEGLYNIRARFQEPMRIFVCVDNQNALRSRSGGPTSGREYVKECLEEELILRQRGCRISGKWTLSHQGITGNEHADTLAKKGTHSQSCHWTRATLTSAKYQPRQILHKANNGKGRTPFPPTRGLPKNAAVAIARMRHHLTTMDKNPLRPAPPCTCDGRASSAIHILLECPLQTEPRAKLLAGHHSPVNWTSITQDNIRPKALLEFMNETGLIKVRKIITNNQDTRDANYELREDI